MGFLQVCHELAVVFQSNLTEVVGGNVYVEFRLIGWPQLSDQAFELYLAITQCLP